MRKVKEYNKSKKLRAKYGRMEGWRSIKSRAVALFRLFFFLQRRLHNSTKARAEALSEKWTQGGLERGGGGGYLEGGRVEATRAVESMRVTGTVHIKVNPGRSQLKRLVLSVGEF